jgi:hypothetical protein
MALYVAVLPQYTEPLLLWRGIAAPIAAAKGAVAGCRWQPLPG